MSINFPKDWLAQDPGHPIPSVYSYDNVVTFEGGGAYLGLIVATPLSNDERSVGRLLEKLKYYLEGLFSSYGHAAWGTPVAGKMRIYLKIHPETHPSFSMLLDKFEAEAKSMGVDIVRLAWSK